MTGAPGPVAAPGTGTAPSPVPSPVPAPASATAGAAAPCTIPRGLLQEDMPLLQATCCPLGSEAGGGASCLDLLPQASCCLSGSEAGGEPSCLDLLPQASCCLSGSEAGTGPSCLDLLPIPRAVAEGLPAGSAEETRPDDAAGMLLLAKGTAGPLLATAATDLPPPALPRRPSTPVLAITVPPHAPLAAVGRIVGPGSGPGRASGRLDGAVVLWWDKMTMPGSLWAAHRVRGPPTMPK